MPVPQDAVELGVERRQGAGGRARQCQRLCYGHPAVGVQLAKVCRPPVWRPRRWTRPERVDEGGASGDGSAARHFLQVQAGSPPTAAGDAMGPLFLHLGLQVLPTTYYNFTTYCLLLLLTTYYLLLTTYYLLLLLTTYYLLLTTYYYLLLTTYCLLLTTY